MGPRGVLSEGLSAIFSTWKTPLNLIDGIHVDMNHLKTGEVK